MYKLPNPAAPILALENVSLSHAGRELRGVSFAAYAGRVTALIGHINAGKTSILRILLNLETPSSGQILICGKPYIRLDDPKTAVAAVPTTIPHSSYCSAGTYLRWKALWSGAPDTHLNHVVQMTGLQSVLSCKLKALTVIDTVKIRFAVALLSNPKALIMDEPFQGLDQRSTAWVQEQIRKQANRGVAMLISSEPDERVESIADDVVILNRGMVTREGSLGQLRNNHDTLRQFFPSLHD